MPHAAAELLRTQKEVDPRKVFVAGHGLGGYVGPRIAEQDGKLAGLIILAGNARPIEDVIVEQAEYLGVAAKDLEGIKAAGEAGQVTGASGYRRSESAGSAGVLSPRPEELRSGRRGEETRNTSAHSAGRARLSIEYEGFRDVEDRAGVPQGRRIQKLPTLNHLFVAGEGKSTEAEYRKLGHVAPEVVDDIAKWVTR